MDARLAREALLDRQDLRGRSWCPMYREWADRWLGELLASAGAPSVGMALVAVGGYGRGDLCPESDLDVVLVHGGGAEVEEVAKGLWYPIWDAGLKLGHAVRTIGEARSLAATDLDTATSLLSCRHLGGDASLTEELHSSAMADWRKRSNENLPTMFARIEQRHREAGEVAFLLEPDLKEGRGGLRDVHALQWLELSLGHDPGELSGSLAEEYGVLLDIRVELHRRTGGPSDRLSLQEQDALVEVFEDADADALMARVATAARTITWESDEIWERVRRAPAKKAARRGIRLRSKAKSPSVQEIAPGIVSSLGEACLATDTDLAGDFTWTLRVAAAAATHDLLIDRDLLDALSKIPGDLAEPWSDEARDLFVELLGAGQPMIRVVESLDHVGLFSRILPEWEPSRSKPQRNAYHRFTVDRHLLEAVYQASKLVDAVSRPDLLVVGALLHDIGKGYPGDHTEVGMDLVAVIAQRMGFPADDCATLVDMVRLHLLLPDVATRRDLDDEVTIAGVAREVGNPATLELLDALTEADSIATGPAAWGAWKAGLVRTLVSRTSHVLTGGQLPDVVGSDFPSTRHRELMAAGDLFIEGSGDTVTIISPDRPGLFSRVAGTLSLHGLEVLEAQVDSDEAMAVEVVRVRNTMNRDIPWDRFELDLGRALNGRLALHPRLIERAGLYDKPTPRASGNVSRKVTVDNEAAENSTVIEVVSEDQPALLFRITRAMAEMLLDIKSARVQTLGADVVDSFYVTDSDGNKIIDPEHLSEIELAIQHCLREG